MRLLYDLTPISSRSHPDLIPISSRVVLAINVFQIVLVENTPETGYLNALALYTVLNTVTPHRDLMIYVWITLVVVTMR